MKLKKIASLALAGIMAVSMLAGCKDGGNSNSGSSSSEPTASTGYTASVLAKTNLAKDFVDGKDDSKLDAMVSAIAEKKVSYTYGTGYSLNRLTDQNAWDMAEKLMTGAMTGASGMYGLESHSALTDPAESNDGVYYALYYVENKYADDLIDSLVADKLDSIAKSVINSTNANVNNTDYTVSVAKADMKISETASGTAKDGFVLVGIAVTTDYTAPQY
ncbi:hypothetical protein [Faecalibacterium sp. An121]|uniref:hypothetical protein n=1 Tax=Faecalibacterium sp. An121 TaxID=1965550 RepID=UPI000B3AF2F3|nr:hypothetical protein [Faecalibacterium sp. An121]OUQ33470.1 hypothetical protein B5E66_12665 [Faecalibacterium sp. An121]